MSAVIGDRDLVSGIELDCEGVDVIYAAYLLTKTGRRTDFNRE